MSVSCQFPIKGNRNPEWQSTSGHDNRRLRRTSFTDRTGRLLWSAARFVFRLRFVCEWLASRPDRQFSSRIYALRFSMEAVLGRGGTFYESEEGSIQRTWQNVRCPRSDCAECLLRTSRNRSWPRPRIPPSGWLTRPMRDFLGSRVPYAEPH